MNEKNTVTVKIYGQEYSICGVTAREYIMKVADYVDSRMNELGLGTNIPLSSVAVLAAINICDELMHSRADNVCLNEENKDLHANLDRAANTIDNLQKDIEDYQQRIDSFSEYSNQVQKQFSDKELQISGLMKELTRVGKENESLKCLQLDLNEQIEALKEKLNSSQNAPEEASNMIKQLEIKCRDVECSFFDLQMENIELKNKLEALRKQNN